MNLERLGIGKDEQVQAVYRRHWFHLALEAAAYALIFGVACGLVGAGEVLVSARAGSLSAPLALGLFGLAFLGLCLWLRFFVSWSDHWLDVWVMTSSRMLDVEQRGFFSRQVSSYPLDRVQDVTYEVSGIIPTWLHFGDVRVQTASISSDLVMRQVHYPDRVKDELLRAVHARRVAGTSE